MRWHDILAETTTLAAAATLDNPEITGVAYDSRTVYPGTLFVGMRGGTVDGNRYLPQARQSGAAAVLTDSPETFAALEATGFPAALVAHGRRALAEASAAFFHHPERQLKLTAVTGTNGKTTTTFLTEALLRAAARPTLLLGTIETHLPGPNGTIQTRLTQHTTPESRDLYALFREAADRGATEAVMEMSSHALDQERVFGLPVDTAIFTNLTQDHLDYHGTMDLYAAAKARLFRGIGAPPPRIAILNADDPACPLMQQAAVACDTRWTYSLNQTTPNQPADFQAVAPLYRAGSTEFLLQTPFGNAEVLSPLTGRVNVYNLLAAIAAATARGLSLDQILAAIPQLRPVPGRFETVPNNLGFTVLVDYAHTDDALRNLLTLARELAHVNQAGAPRPASETRVRPRVLTLFGCGGDRDRTKRPRMGRAAGDLSDFVLITSDNPRSEDPATIATEALAGVHDSGQHNVHIELDRAIAIHQILQEAHPGDIVLLAGKGHEKTQTTNGIARPFDDVAIAAAALRELEAPPGNTRHTP